MCFHIYYSKKKKHTLNICTNSCYRFHSFSFPIVLSKYKKILDPKIFHDIDIFSLSRLKSHSKEVKRTWLKVVLNAMLKCMMQSVTNIIKTVLVDLVPQITGFFTCWSCFSTSYNRQIWVAKVEVRGLRQTTYQYNNGESLLIYVSQNKTCLKSISWSLSLICH